MLKLLLLHKFYKVAEKKYKSIWALSFSFTTINEPYHDKTNKVSVRPAKTQISLGIRSLGHLKQGIQDFHRKYVLVPANKPANNVAVIWRLHYINTLKQELSGTKAYKETSEEEKSVVNGHCNHLALKFFVCVKERQDRLPTMYWLPKLHKWPYKARFIANSSSCTTTELSKLLTSCRTAVKNHVGLSSLLETQNDINFVKTCVKQ